MSGHEAQICKRKKNLKRKRNPQPLSDTTTDEVENIESDSADDVSFRLDKDESGIEYKSDKTDPLEAAVPVVIEYSIGKYYSVYYTEPYMMYFWGKITRTFDNDDGGPVTKVEADCRQRNTSPVIPRN